MDNDNKIEKSKNIHDEVMLFLGDEVKRIHKEIENNSYDIEKEYAKTKKNRSPVNILVLLGAFAIVICTVFFMNRYISVKDQEIEVSLTEFEDLNLNNLLNTVATVQVNYDNALKEKLSIETEFETKLDNLNTELENSLFILESLNLDNKKEYNRRKNKLESDNKIAVEELNKEYESKLLLAQKKTDEYKKQLDEFDTVKVSNAQEKEKLVNSERQLKQLEINRLKKSYDERISEMDAEMNEMKEQYNNVMRTAVQDVAKKYQSEIDTLDPTIVDRNAMAIINAAGTIGNFNGEQQVIDNNISEVAVIDNIKEYQKLYDNFSYLFDVIQNIPKKNSLPAYEKAARSLVNVMGRNYVETSAGYMNHITEKNSMIEERDKTIEEKENEIDNKNGEISKKNNIISEKNMIIQNQQNEITLKTNELKNANNQLQNKINDIAGLNKEITELNNVISKQKTENNISIENKQKEMEMSFSDIFSKIGIEAVLLGTSDYDNLQVFIVPAFRDLIGENGIPAKLVIPEDSVRKKWRVKVLRPEITITGNVYLAEDNNYYFKVGVDEDGELIQVDFSLLNSGMAVDLEL